MSYKIEMGVFFIVPLITFTFCQALRKILFLVLIFLKILHVNDWYVNKISNLVGCPMSLHLNLLFFFKVHSLVN